jgi:hypothetical protein
MAQYPSSIYVHFSAQRYIIYITNDSLRDIQKGILEKSRIPIDLQMIVYQGRILGHTSNVALQPYDFVQVLVRGKGGMQNEETGVTTPEGKLDEDIQSFYFVVFSFVNCSWKHEAPLPYQ